MLSLIFSVIVLLLIIVLILVSVAYFTLLERKIIGSIQRRRGPNVVGVFGLLQPLVDGLKLLTKELIIPISSNKFLFRIAPLLTFVLSLLVWIVIPFNVHSIISELELGLLYLLAVSALNIYGVLLSGWSSNSKYPFLGSLRSTAQMISYELSIGFIVLIIVSFSGSFKFIDIVLFQQQVWNVVTLSSLFFIFFSIGLAETNRHPYDLPEAEAELVSGYNTEYSGMKFALFSLAEYGHMITMSILITLFFLAGWLAPFNVVNCEILGSFFFVIKVLFFIILFIYARAALPRYRYDQLMDLGWKIYLPFLASFFYFNSTLLSLLDISYFS